MKRSIKIDLKFAAVTLFLSAFVIFMIYIFSSSAVLAEDGFVGEYVDEFAAGTTLPQPATTAAAKAPAQAQTIPTVEAAKIGTASDPLITLSYLQNVLVPQIEASLLAKVNPSAAKPETSAPAVVNAGYEVIELSRGQTLSAKTGSIEIIVRPGTSALSVSPFGNQGLADLTDGTEILNGESLPINHILLVPRNDGRGIAVTSSKAYIMVRGDYEIR